MKTYFKALRKCHVHVKLNDNWLLPVMWLYKLKLGVIAKPLTHLGLKAYKWHEATKEEMLSQSRLFIAYDGALSCAGRDTDEFIHDCINRMGESMEFFMGRVSPRVEMEIAFDDPDRFPYQYVKWTTLINIYLIRNYLSKHKLWISITGILITTNVITMLFLGAN